MSGNNFDIEHFPTSETALRMMERISPIYEKSYVGKWIFQVMGLELDEVRLRFSELAAQAFPETATWSLAYWEQRYGLPVSEGKDIYLRRQAILSRQRDGAPLNPKRMEAILSALTGREVVITEDMAPYTFAVEIMDGDSAFDYAETVKRIKTTKPSHQAFTVQLTLKTPTNLVAAAFTEARLAVEIWPATVETAEAATARMGVLGVPQSRYRAEVQPGTVERIEATAGARTAAGAQHRTTVGILPGTVTAAETTVRTSAAAGAQQNTVLRVWPGAVERVETRSGASGAAVEIHQTIEIWP